MMKRAREVVVDPLQYAYALEMPSNFWMEHRTNAVHPHSHRRNPFAQNAATAELPSPSSFHLPHHSKSCSAAPRVIYCPLVLPTQQ